MNDLRVASVRRILPITGARLRAGPPPSLELAGEDFHFASTVLVNNQTAQFLVVSDRSLLVEIPKAVVDHPLERVQVLTEVPTAREPNLVVFSLGTAFRSTSGFDSTVQLFLKILLMTPGTDRFHLPWGGGLLRLAGCCPGSEQDRTYLQASIVDAVLRTKEQIVALQTRRPGWSNDERLGKAEVRSVGYNVRATSLPVVVALTSVSGKRVLAGVEV